MADSKKKFVYNQRRVHTPTVLQMEALECGAASLAMILGYYGCYVPLERLRVECNVTRDGSNAAMILKTAKKYGLEAHGFKREIEYLKNSVFPAIIFWNFNHFVVLEGFKGNKAYINDPASGRRTVSYEEFDTSYTGIILEFSKTKDFKKEGYKPSVMRSLKKRVTGMGNIILYVILLGLLLLIPGFAIPAFSRFFVDKILVGGMTGFLKPLLVAMALATILQALITSIQSYCLKKFHLKLALSSSAKFVDHIFKMPVVFFTQRLPGEICNRIQSNDTVATLVSSKLASAVINLLCIVFYGILMFIYDVPLTLMCIGVLIVNFIILRISSNIIKTNSLKVQIEKGKLYGQTMNGIMMIETLKASGLENDFFQEWSGQQAKVVMDNNNLTRLSSLFNQIPYSLTQILNLLVLTVGAIRIMHGDLTIGMLAGYQILQGSFITPINQFLELGTEMQSSYADMQRLDDVMNYSVEKRFKEDYANENESENTDESENKNPEAISKLEGYISLKDVSFGYSPYVPPLINGLNLELKPGSRVALVGGSGSGKSTIGKIISSLYKPWSGQVLFDGKPVSEIDRATFTGSVSVVSQNIFLFEGSVKDNITMWDNAIPESVFIQAAKDACIHDVITERKGGYYSKVEEGGCNFSGGQRQRLEIARALATNPRILIMDEATSALDPVSEHIIDENIRRRGCTCVIIAHRLSTIRDSDEIIVLDQGKIVQRGTHDELISEGGLYAELIKTM